MSEIRDRAKGYVAGFIWNFTELNKPASFDLAEKILSIKELAIVDREAELPYFTRHKSEEIERLTKGEVYGLALIDILKEGLVKEVE